MSSPQGQHLTADGSRSDNGRFLQDLARVVPSLSLSGVRGADLLQTFLQESQASVEATTHFGCYQSHPQTSMDETSASRPQLQQTELANPLLKGLSQVGLDAAQMNDPAIRARAKPRTASRAASGTLQWKRPPSSAPSVAGSTPNAESLVARSLLSATPSPFQPPTSSNPDLTELNWDEEGTHSHWPVDDETIFYRYNKLEPSAEQHGIRGFYDLNIVMPVVLPGAEIRVLNADGENYYKLAASNPGGHLLFGRESRIKAASSLDNDQVDIIGEQTSTLETDDDNFPVQPPSEAVPYPTVCDVWATFLNAQLGTIRNCRGNQIVEVCQLFNAAFYGDEYTQFLVPITVDCRGIYPVPKSPAANTSKTKRSFERYETRGVFLTENDRRRFRIIRRRLKRFVLTLWERFGVQCDGPRFDVALGGNCRSSHNDNIRVEIRRYGALSHSQLLKHIWKQSVGGRRLDTHPVFELPGLPALTAQTRVVLNEVRLEMTHARMVDPRWPDQWVLARRMPAIPASANRRSVMARYVFCSRVAMPRVVYEFNQPKKTLLKSRFAPLFLLADVARRDVIALEEEERQRREDNAAKTKLSAAAVPFFPLSAVLNKLAATQQVPSNSPGHDSQFISGTRGDVTSPTHPLSAWDRLVTSATIAGVVDSSLGGSSSFYSSNRTTGTLAPSSNPLGMMDPPTSGVSDDTTFINRLSPAINVSSLLSPPSARRIMTEGVSPFLPTALRKTPYSNRYIDNEMLPLTEEPCKFYQAGVCARGNSCYFLHAADPQLQNRIDVRHLSPANPIFF